MKGVFFVANSNKTFRTKGGIVGGSGRAYKFSRQISIVSSNETFVNNDFTSKDLEHITSLLCDISWPNQRSWKNPSLRTALWRWAAVYLQGMKPDRLWF